jgi:hypothetical protein
MNTIVIIIIVVLLIVGSGALLYNSKKNESKQQQILGKVFGNKEKFYFEESLATAVSGPTEEEEERAFINNYGSKILYCPVTDKQILLQQFRLADEIIKLLNDPEFQKCLDNIKLMNDTTKEVYVGKQLILDNIDELNKLYKQLKEYGIPSNEKDIEKQYYNVSLLYMFFSQFFEYLGIALAGSYPICDKQLLDTFYVLLLTIQNQIFYLIKRDLKQPVITYDQTKNIIKIDVNTIKEVTGKDITETGIPTEGTPEDYSKAFEKDIFARRRQQGTAANDSSLKSELQRFKLWNKHPEVLQKQFKVTSSGYDCMTEFRN